MTRFLIFTLYAPLAAFGEIAVGERRMGWSRPARSAVLGLVAGCLGLKRDEEAAHDALEAGYGYAVRTDHAGNPLDDFHTIQVPSGRRYRGLPTRRHELTAERLETVISYREYRTDAMHTAVLWARQDPPYPLDAVMSALRSPKFAPYLGRKSAPLGLPMAPELIAADTLGQALAKRSWPLLLPKPAEPGTEVAFDLDAPGMVPAQIETRHDAIGSRRRWQFGWRREGIAPLPAEDPTP